MIKDFTQHLGLKFLRQEGNELIHECPWCSGPKFYVNSTTGAWQCFHGCGEGHPYQLVKKLTALEAKGVFELLERFGLGQDTAKTHQPTEQAVKKLYLKPEDVRTLPLLDQLTFCHAKGLSRDALAKLRPYRHAREPWVLIPAFDPGDMNKACGWIRSGIDGQLIPIKYMEDGVVKVKEEKYPVVKGSQPGLLGLHALGERQTDTIYYVEGWKDLTAALQFNLPALANSNGAGKWRDSWLKVFKDKIVYIVGDCDDAGVKGAKKFAAAIHGTAKDVLIVSLPYEHRPKNGEDLHDYIVRDKHTKEDLQALINKAARYVPEPEQANKGIIILPDDNPDTIAEAFWRNSRDKDVQHKYNRYDGWSIYHKDKYQRVEDIKEIRLHIRKFIAKCCLKKKGVNIRIKQSSGFIGDILEALAAMEEVHLLPSKKAPCSLDGKLNAQYTIATNNALIDISSRPYKVEPVSKQFYTLNYLTYNYEKDAFSDKWGSFLADITQSDLDLMLLLQQWCGYLLLPTLKYQKFVICVGDGANGKGVFFDTITAALGRKNVSNVPLARFDNPYAIYGSYGKLVNMSNENARNIEDGAESLIKEYVAGDQIVWEQKYKDAFFAFPTAKLMFATNELPKIKDVSDGIWRRLILIPFNAKFTGNKQNTNLAKELQQPEELAGILNWMLEGAEILEKSKGFIEPNICKNALDKYRDESDSVRMFLTEMMEIDPDGETENACQIPCTWLHQQYQKWCDENGFKAKNNVHFGQTVFQLYPVQKSRPWFGERKVNVYVGMKPQEGSEIFGELKKWTA